MRKAILISVVVVVAIAAVGVYLSLEQKRIQIKQEREELGEMRQKYEMLVREVQEERQSVKRDLEMLSPRGPGERALEIFGPGVGRLFEDEHISCLELYGMFRRYMEHIDTEGYLIASGIARQAEDHFRGLLPIALGAAPQVARETDDLYLIIKNSAHFYRVLGKKNTFALSNILRREAALMEPALALIYRLIRSSGRCSQEPGAIRFDFVSVYKYSGYFLNTLGGRSYLFRRSSGVRMLAQYYSILLVDEANRRKLNSYGIDVRPVIDSLLRDLRGSITLRYRDRYVERLEELRTAYLVKYGQ